MYNKAGGAGDKGIYVQRSSASSLKEERVLEVEKAFARGCKGSWII